MSAETEKQARFMRLVNARQHGHNVGGPSVKRAAGSMSPGDVHDFMHTKTRPKTILGGRKGY